MKEGYEAGAVDFKPILVKIKAAKPDFVYMISYVMDASLLMRQSKELDFNPKLFVVALRVLPSRSLPLTQAKQLNMSFQRIYGAPQFRIPALRSTMTDTRRNSGFHRTTTEPKLMRRCTLWQTL